MSLELLLENDRALYHEAYKMMYWSDKSKYQDKIYDEVNPLQNKKMGTEMDVWSGIAVEKVSPDEAQQWIEDHPKAMSKSTFDVKKYGIPVAVQSWVLTGKDGIQKKMIGKQMISDPLYERRGIMTALITATANQFKNITLDHFYIGCSHFSAPIIQKRFLTTPFKEDEDHDMFKFNIPTKNIINDKNVMKYIIERGFTVKVL